MLAPNPDAHVACIGFLPDGALVVGSESRRIATWDSRLTVKRAELVVRETPTCVVASHNVLISGWCFFLRPPPPPYMCAR